MAQKTFIEISSNLPKFIRTFKNLGGTEEQLDDVAFAAALEAIGDAINLAPVDEGRLVQSIGLEPRPDIGNAVYSLTASVKYAPYQEFGTGDLVEVPQELTQYARQFKGKGIRKVNIKAKPYLYPAALRAQAKILRDLKKFIEFTTGKKTD